MLSFYELIEAINWNNHLVDYHPDDHADITQILEKVNKMYPVAGSTVSGLTVRKEIPNQNSISSSLEDYQILPGVREFPLHGFLGKKSYYSAQDQAHCDNLARQISQSRQITPIIIVEEKNGPYILEGGHRVSALVELNIPSVPALIVIDIDSFYN